jgi:hypothetical protein
MIRIMSRRLARRERQDGKKLDREEPIPAESP